MDNKDNPNNALLSTWVDMTITPPDSLVDLLIAETGRQTEYQPSKEEVVSFLRFLARHSSTLPSTEAVKKRRSIRNDVLIVGPEHKSEYTFLHPKSVKLFGKTEYVRTWKDALLALCRFIAKENPNEFHRVLDGIVGKRRYYFSKRSTSLTDPHLIEGTRIYVETNLSANNIKALCDGLVRYFGYSFESSISFH